MDARAFYKPSASNSIGPEGREGMGAWESATPLADAEAADYDGKGIFEAADAGRPVHGRTGARKKTTRGRSRFSPRENGAAPFRTRELMSTEVPKRGVCWAAREV